MTIIVALGALAWIAAGVAVYGLELAYFQRKYPLTAAESFEDDRAWALVSAFYGPLVIVYAWGVHGNYGWMFKWSRNANE